MTENEVRVIDILSNEEKELLEDYKLGINLARTPIGIRFNKNRAQKLLNNARARYARSNKTLTL